MARRTSRIYDRGSAGTPRFWADFRDYAEVGGGREPLVAPGTTVATSDPDVAAALVARRLEELERRRRNGALLGLVHETTLGDYLPYHLDQLAATVTPEWADQARRHLEHARDFFGADRAPETIRVAEVQRWLAELARTPNGRGGTLANGTRRQYLNSLSKFYRRLASEGLVPPGYNPAAALIDKPSGVAAEARWFEVDEAALLLEAARLYRPERSDALGGPRAYAVVAGYLLTGCREMELLGLERGDVNLERGVITVRPNRWRRIKNTQSRRTIRIWPQLNEVLRAYLDSEHAPTGSLFFPSARPRAGAREQLITDLRKTLDSIGALVGYAPGEIRTRMFRHTFCAARLQTLDGGAPVAPYTVGRELGHGGLAMVARVYGHLGIVRHRSEVVEYRVEQHAGALGPRLARLRERAAA
jgi:integrase